MKNQTRIISALCVAVLLAAVPSCSDAEPLVLASNASEAGSSVDVLLCDGETKIPTGKPAADMTPADGKRVADALMAEWQEKNPTKDWMAKELASHSVNKPHDNREILGEGQSDGQTYAQFTARDLLIWERETYKFAVEGSRVFHSSQELGSTIAVSCDMCHPDGSNTHPETYPKYQTQLGKVALLRDMINWCLEHPVRAQKIDPDDPKMRALEAYIYAQRKGKVLEYGKH